MIPARRSLDSYNGETALQGHSTLYQQFGPIAYRGVTRSDSGAVPRGCANPSVRSNRRSSGKSANAIGALSPASNGHREAGPEITYVPCMAWRLLQVAESIRHPCLSLAQSVSREPSEERVLSVTILSNPGLRRTIAAGARGLETSVSQETFANEDHASTGENSALKSASIVQRVSSLSVRYYGGHQP